MDNILMQRVRGSDTEFRFFFGPALVILAALLIASSVAAAALTASPAQAAPGNTTLISDDGCCAPSDGESTFASVSADGRYVAFVSDATNLGAGDTEALHVYLRDRQTGSNEIITVNSDGILGAGNVGQEVVMTPVVSDNGRYVVFEAPFTNLVPGDTNGRPDVFVRDRVAGTTERVSVSNSGQQGTGGAVSQAEAFGKTVSISNDGNLVAFHSAFTNLVPGDTNNRSDVFVHDRAAGTTERVSVTSSETQGTGVEGSTFPAMSGDGRYVAFLTDAPQLAPPIEPPEAELSVVIRDRQLGTTQLVSVNSGEAPANMESGPPSISDDGRYVAFESLADNLNPLAQGGDGNLIADVFVRDRQLGTTERVSVSSEEREAGGLNSTAKYSGRPDISDNGRYVAFDSDAPNLVTGDTNKMPDVFVRDRTAGTTQRASVSSSGAQAPATSKGAELPSISSPAGTARPVVAFESDAVLVPGDANQKKDIFVHELPAAGGGPGPGPSGAPRVTVTTPADRATAVPAGTSLTATFSKAMRPASINDVTFILTKAIPPAEGGGVEEISGDVTYNATTKKATLNPNGPGVNPLEPGNYTATVKIGARDTTGIQLDQNATQAGNQPKIWRFTVGR